MAQISHKNIFSLDESLHKRWFWVSLIAIGYVLAINSAIFALGSAVVLFSLPTALLPLIPAYTPPEKRFRMTIIMSALVYVTIVGVLISTSYLGFSLENLMSYSFTLFLGIPSFFVRGPLELFFGSFALLPILAGLIVISFIGWALYKLPTFSDRSIRLCMSLLIVSMAMGAIDCYQLGLDLGYLGEGFYFSNTSIVP